MILVRPGSHTPMTTKEKNVSPQYEPRNGVGGTFSRTRKPFRRHKPKRLVWPEVIR